jgi:hypothetical protein
MPTSGQTQGRLSLLGIASDVRIVSLMVIWLFSTLIMAFQEVLGELIGGVILRLTVGVVTRLSTGRVSPQRLNLRVLNG